MIHHSKNNYKIFAIQKKWDVEEIIEPEDPEDEPTIIIHHHKYFFMRRLINANNNNFRFIFNNYHTEEIEIINEDEDE